jgi:hypothetical protein
VKRGGPEHPKTKRLAKCLQQPPCVAVGVLELLFHATAKYARTGNIGRWTNAEIAEGCGWDGDPDQLVNALIECGWLDLHPEHRLVVHDWHDHADQSVIKTIRRNGEEFVSDSIPSMSGNVYPCLEKKSPPVPVPVPVPDPEPEPERVSESRGRVCEGDSPKPQPTIVERVAARIGHDIGSEGINLIRGQDRYAARGDVLVHGQPVPALDLFDRCVVAALAEPGFSYRHASAFLNYVGVIFNRCERDQVWPEEQRAPTAESANRVTASATAQADRLRKRRENRQ